MLINSNFDILSLFQNFVNYFFNFFQVVFSSQFFKRTSIDYHIYFYLSTTFLIFFNLPIEDLCFLLSLSDSFIILSPVPVFVNTFFSTFFKIFFLLQAHRQSCHSTLLQTRPCQRHRFISVEKTPTSFRW